MTKGVGIYLSVLFLIVFNNQNIAQVKSQVNQADRVDYLIITTDELKADFEPLVNWKFRKGLKTEIITMEEINSRYDETTIQLKIKSCLFDYYTNRDLVWALLGGNQEVVPVQGCYSKVRLGSSDLEDASVPTDLFYACFGGRFDWNSNLNDKIGEIYLDGHDLVPNIHLSRIPVQISQEVKSYVKKTLDYEMNPPLEGFLEEMLLSGVRSFTSWDGKSDNHHRSELLARQYVSDNWNGETTLFFDTGTDFPSGESYHVTTENFMEQINKGYGIIHFAGPGNSKVLKMEWGRNFEVSDVEKLTNPVSGLVLSTSGMVNAYDSEDTCLSEAFLKNPEGGAVAFFGSSRLGFGNPDSTFAFGPSMSYSAVFLEELFATDPEVTDHSFGAIVSRTKSEFIYSGGAGGTYHYLLYAINPMGDPELPVYRGKPRVFDNVRVFRFGNTLTVNAGGVENCKICMTHVDISSGYQEVIENIGSHTFSDISDAFYLTISKPGYIPYHLDSGLPTQIVEGIYPLIHLYPNPFTDILNLEIIVDKSWLVVYDLHGRRLKETEIRRGVNRIDLSLYPPGTYFLKVDGDDRATWHKVIKQQ